MGRTIINKKVKERVTPSTTDNNPVQGEEMAVYGDHLQGTESATKDSSVARAGRMAKSKKEGLKYKSIPEDWKVISPTRFSQAIANIEAVLLEISPDGTLNGNPFDWKPTIPALNRWAHYLRTALKELTKYASVSSASCRSKSQVVPSESQSPSFPEEFSSQSWAHAAPEPLATYCAKGAALARRL